VCCPVAYNAVAAVEAETDEDVVAVVRVDV